MPWAHKKLIEYVKACGVCGSVPDGLAQAAISQNLPSKDTMLLRRLRLYWLNHKLPIQEDCKIPECPSCFAQLDLYYADPAHQP